jgi:DNA recombination protein RmuC
MNLLLIALGCLVGGAVVGAVGWMVGTARERARGEARLRDALTAASASAARADVMTAQARQAEERARALDLALREAERQRAVDGERAETLARNLDEQRDAEARLTDTFKALAADVLRANQEGFLTLANQRLGAAREQAALEAEARQVAQQQALEGMVAPVRASLEKVDEQIRAMERERGTAYGELRQQLRVVTETQVKLHDATGSLVSALKAPAVRGRWGEMQLRRVVELAGMLEHCDFDEQTTLAGVDGRLRPDMIIHLPGGRRIVVDAKAPLGAYLEAREAPDDETRAAKYRQHAAQVRAHITKLGAKSYWDALDAAPDMVVMFLPGEPLYSVALEHMPELMEEGQAQKVMVATPMTLIALLRTASFGWREERLAENAQRISDEGRRLHERIATVMEHFADLGNSLNQSVKHFNKSLRSFEQRVVVSARRLDEMDARGKKEVVPLEEIDARAVGPQLPEKPQRADAAQRRQLTQQPLLTLAPPPDGEG